MLKILIEAFKASKGRMPNAIEMLQLKFKEAGQAGKGKVLRPDFGKNNPWYKDKPTTGKSAGITSINKKAQTAKTIDEDKFVADFMANADRVYYKFVNETLAKVQNASKDEQLKIAKDIINRKGMFHTLDEKDSAKILKSIDQNIKPVEPKAYGGVAGMLGERTGFKLGGIDKARRLFLQAIGAGAAGIGAAKTGLFGLLKGAGKKEVAQQVVKTPNAPGKPEWFDALITRVINEGDDVTKQFAYKERMKVHTKPISETEEVTVYRDLDDGSVRINYGSKLKIDETKPYERGNISRASNDPDQVDLIVRQGEVIEPNLATGKGGGKTKSSFEASEAEPRAVGGPEDADIEFDGIREVNNVDDLMQDVSSLEEFATGKKLTGEKAAKAKKKREDYQRFTEDQVEQAEYLETKYGPYDDSAMDDLADDFASGGIARMLGE